jgi:hypothetical protein
VLSDVRGDQPHILYINSAFEEVWGMPRAALFEDSSMGSEPIAARASDSGSTFPLR